MTLFNQSTKAVSSVVQEIADSAGVSADTEMLNRAGRSLNAALEHIPNRVDWNFTLVEAPLIQVFGPFTVTGVTASANQTSAAFPAGHGVLIDDIVNFAGAAIGVRATATAAGGVGFTFPIAATFAGGTATALVTALINRDMYPLPSDWKKPYSMRLYGAMSAPRMLTRRQYDRSMVNEFQNSTTVGYDVYPIPAKGKIRLLPQPAAADVMELKYYRRLTVPTTTATADPLDVPQDYEPYFIAWAKWHFLTDKGEGRSQQAQTWFAFANDGFKTMLADQTRFPDEDLMMVPGFYSYNPAFGPNSVRNTLDNMWG